ncbi:hypothetical protein C8Q77DRAFT_1121420 [Trametes polyzona]|nr:hypothetical protein C8Q77DRAFT_1121420 [Trametes polyzona]
MVVAAMLRRRAVSRSPRSLVPTAAPVRCVQCAHMFVYIGATRGIRSRWYRTARRMSVSPRCSNIQSSVEHDLPPVLPQQVLWSPEGPTGVDREHRSARPLRTFAIPRRERACPPVNAARRGRLGRCDVFRRICDAVGWAVRRRRIQGCSPVCAKRTPSDGPSVYFAPAPIPGLVFRRRRVRERVRAADGARGFLGEVCTATTRKSVPCRLPRSLDVVRTTSSHRSRSVCSYPASLQRRASESSTARTPCLLHRNVGRAPLGPGRFLVS